MGLEEGLGQERYASLRQEGYASLRKETITNIRERVFGDLPDRADSIVLALLASKDYTALDEFLGKYNGLIEQKERYIERRGLPEAIPAPSPEAIVNPLKQRLFEKIKSGEISRAEGLKEAAYVLGMPEKEYFEAIGVKKGRVIGGIKGAAWKHHGYSGKK